MIKSLLLSCAIALSVLLVPVGASAETSSGDIPTTTLGKCDDLVRPVIVQGDPTVLTAYFTSETVIDKCFLVVTDVLVARFGILESQFDWVLTSTEPGEVYRIISADWDLTWAYSADGGLLLRATTTPILTGLNELPSGNVTNRQCRELMALDPAHDTPEALSVRFALESTVTECFPVVSGSLAARFDIPEDQFDWVLTATEPGALHRVISGDWSLTWVYNHDGALLLLASLV